MPSASNSGLLDCCFFLASSALYSSTPPPPPRNAPPSHWQLGRRRGELVDNHPHARERHKVTHDGHPPQKRNGNREKVAKQVDEAKHLDAHANDRPADEDEQHAAEKEGAAFGLFSLEEEAVGALDANDERHAREEEQVAHGQEGLVKEEQDAQNHKGQAKGRQANANFCKRLMEGSGDTRGEDTERHPSNEKEKTWMQPDTSGSR